MVRQKWILNAINSVVTAILVKGFILATLKAGFILLLVYFILTTGSIYLVKLQ